MSPLIVVLTGLFCKLYALSQKSIKDKANITNMAVYYKFKSSRVSDSIPMVGSFITLRSLKSKIFDSKNMRRGTDYDLVVTNPQTNEGRFVVYSPFRLMVNLDIIDEVMFIFSHKYTFMIVAGYVCVKVRGSLTDNNWLVLFSLCGMV